ncbi:MAG TPA: sugar ABC transporter substrate-binding protein [Chloroflexota bacterium]|nr:sugar ABC transporter substrate-binding protein [Chloroflexota bacterium]
MPTAPPRRTRRHALSATAAAATGAALLAACGQAGQPGAPGSAPGKVSGQVSLLYYTSTEPAIERMRKQEAGFRAKYPDVQLSVEAQPTDFTNKITTLLAGGAPPSVTWIGGAFWDFVGKGVWVDLDPLIARDRAFNLKDYYPQALDAFRWPDKLRALPYGVNTHTISYNKRLLQKEGQAPPTKDWTVAQFTELARRVTKDTDGDGNVDQAALGNWPSIHVAPVLFGGGYWDKGFTKSILDTPESIAGLEWLYDIQYGPRKVYATAQMLQGTNVNNLMGAGKLAFYSTGRFGVPVLRNLADLDWDMVVYPTGPKGNKSTFLSGEGYAMTSETKDRDAAWKLMDYLCGREAQEQFYLLEGSVIPAIKAVAESKPFHESPPGKNHQAHLDSIAFGAPFATHPVNTRLVNEVITPLWKDVTDAKMQPREFAAQAARRMNDLLKEFK